MTEVVRVDNKAITRAEDALEKARTRLRNVLVQEQLQCKHTLIGEERHGNEGRVCLHCGLWESGYCGFKVLVTSRPVLVHEVWRIRRGARVGDENKGPLTRGECSLKDIIRGQE